MTRLYVGPNISVPYMGVGINLQLSQKIDNLKGFHTRVDSKDVGSKHA